MAYPTILPKSAAVLEEVSHERLRQDAKWGEQNHRNGTGGMVARRVATKFRKECERAFEAGRGSWREILLEEVYEALAESTPEGLRSELIQVAAVAVAWVEKIDRDSRGESA